MKFKERKNIVVHVEYLFGRFSIMGKKETAEAINEDKKKLKKDKKKRKRQKTDEDHVSSAEKIEENEETASNSDRINKKHELFSSDLTESVSANTDGAKSCTSSKRRKKKRKKEKEDCILQGEMSDEDGNKGGCDEIMAETEESLAASVQNSEPDQDEASKKSKKNKKKKKKKKERVNDDEQNSSEKIEMEDVPKLEDSDSECVEFDNSGDNVSVVKRDSKSKSGGKKRKQKNELVDSKDMESTCLTNDDSPGEEKEEYEEPVKKKKKKSKEKDKAKNRLVEEKEKPELSEKNDDAVGNQWQCAQFGDTAQKEKFLRLMGANKPSNKQRPASSYSVMAMDRQQEKVLSNSLEKQFLQALQTRKERGLGLGYQ